VKEFSKLERNIVEKILSIHNNSGLNVLGNILGSIDNIFGFTDYYLEFSSDDSYSINILTTSYEAMVNKYGFASLDALIKNIDIKILEIIKLIEYLDENNYIYITGDLKLSILGNKVINDSYISLVKDKEVLIATKIRSYITKNITPDDRLSKLVDNNYLSDDEIKLRDEQDKTKKSLNIAFIAVIISGLTLLSSVGFSIWGETNVNLLEIKSIIKVESDKLTKEEKILSKKAQSVSKDIYFFVNADVLRVRKYDSTDSKTISKLKKNDLVILLKSGKLMSLIKWQTNDDEAIIIGWVSNKYIIKINSKL